MVLVAVMVIVGLFLLLPTIVKSLQIRLNNPKLTALIDLLNLNYKIESLVTGERYTGKISKIHIHPIKSVSFLSVDSWEVDQYGLKHDRQYMFGYWNVKKDQYEGCTIRQCAKFALVRITVNLKENWFNFAYDYEGKESSFRLPCDVSDDFIQKNLLETHETKTNLWGVNFETYNIGKAVPKEFFTAMGLEGRYKDLTLLYTKQHKYVKTLHPKDLKEKRETQFQDYYPIHVINQEGIDDLNQRLQKQGFERTIRPEQFRPNIVVDDFPSSINLDEWYKVELRSKDPTGVVKSHRFKSAVRAPRCTIPNNNLDTGEYDKTNRVTKEMHKYREIDAGSPKGYFFGHYLIQYEYGYTISVGDKFYLKQKRINLFEDLV